MISLTRGDLENHFLLMCEKNEYAEVKKMVLKNPELIHYSDDLGMRLAASAGSLETVKILLLDKELPEHSYIFAKGCDALIAACTKGHLQVVDFLLTDQELPIKAYIHAQNDMPLRKACYHNKIDVVKFLMLSDKLNDHGNIYADQCRTLFQIFSERKQKPEVFEFVYEQYELEINSYIETYMEKNKEFKAIFLANQLNRQLNLKNNINLKKLKV